MKVEKKEALKNLWSAYEDILKSLKAVSENPMVGTITNNMWDALNIYQKDIRQLPKLDTEFGKWYKWTTYNEDEILIFKSIHLESGKDKTGLSIKGQVLASLKTRHSYEDAEEFMYIPLDTYLSDDRVQEIILNPQDLPLYINYEFKGSLFGDLMKNSEQT